MANEPNNLSTAVLAALKNKGFTLERLSQTTGVSERFLSSLIEERFEDLPAAPYVRGYLLKVAEALNLDGEKLWSDYLKDNELIRRSGKSDRLPKNRFALPKIRGKMFFTAAALLIVLVLIFLRLSFLGNSAGLTLFSPAEETVFTSEPAFRLLGRLETSYQLTLNGERLYPDAEGNFQKTISLKDGFNTLVFSFKKFLSEEKTITRQIFYNKEVRTIP